MRKGFTQSCIADFEKEKASRHQYESGIRRETATAGNVYAVRNVQVAFDMEPGYNHLGPEYRWIREEG